MPEALGNTLRQNRCIFAALARKNAREQLANLDASVAVKGLQYGEQEGRRNFERYSDSLKKLAGIEAAEEPEESASTYTVEDLLNGSFL